MAGVHEQSLPGGMTTADAVWRDGEHVVRPASPHTASVHAFLDAVRRAGFEGAPEPFEIDPDGRERLAFIAGDVPGVPYPAWCLTDEATTASKLLFERASLPVTRARSSCGSGRTAPHASNDAASGGATTMTGSLRLSPERSSSTVLLTASKRSRAP